MRLSWEYIKFPKWSCVLNCCSECPGIFVTDAEINDEDDVNLPFIQFYHYKNISFCYFHTQLFPDHGKICPSWMNLEFFEKGTFTTRKSLLLKSCIILDFHSEYYIPDIGKLAFHLPHVYILGKIIVWVNGMICLWFNTLSLTEMHTWLCWKILGN